VNLLLDTNVISESIKPHPNAGLTAWLSSVDEDRVYISVVTLAEIRYGVERLPAGNRRKRIEEWLQHDLPARFQDRILPIDEIIADLGGRFLARSEAAGRPLEAMDAFLAATAEAHRLTLVTRNQSDFEAILHTTLNPWT
jgi:predicted nucleic acid-binding protein